MPDSYKFISLIYEFGCTLLSGSLIKSCRISNLNNLKPSDKILFAGVGHGKDALFAAQAGAHVTVIDSSKSMLHKFNQLIKKETCHSNINLIHDDILKYNDFNEYDIIVANFFLNVFHRKKMQLILCHLINLSKKNGQIIIGDFIYPNGSILSNFIKNTYWYMILIFFWMFTGNDFHRIYNYPEIIKSLGLNVIKIKYTGIWKFKLFWSIVAKNINPRINNNFLTTFSHQERISYLKQYGTGSLSFSTCQPHVEYFDIYGIGYITYKKYFKFVFVLSNPICSEKNYEKILNIFLTCFQLAYFIQVNESVVKLLYKNHNYFGTLCGVESIVNLKNWRLNGSKKNVIRTAINQAKIQKIEIKENQLLKETKKISELWIKTRRCKKNEIEFLIRPIFMEYKEGTRYFYASILNESIGFICFDPIYRSGKIIGYVPNISRSTKLFKQGIWYSIMAFALEKFKLEMLDHVNLGIMPFDDLKKIEIYESKPLRITIHKFYSHCHFIFNFNGLKFAKSRFDGETKTVFFCHKKRYPIFAIIALARLARFF